MVNCLKVTVKDIQNNAKDLYYKQMLLFWTFYIYQKILEKSAYKIDF